MNVFKTEPRTRRHRGKETGTEASCIDYSKIDREVREKERERRREGGR
jgi:hypothetical protein